MNNLHAGLLIAGLIPLVAACTAKPVREVSLPPEYPPPAAAATVSEAPPPRVTVRTRVEEAPQARIDELYAATGAVVDTAAAAGRPRRGAAGDITLDFVESDLRDVVRAILGDILNVNFVIDPNVSGKVTLSTGRPVREVDLLPTLEAVLASQGARLIAYDSLYRITRSNAPSAVAGGGIDVGSSPAQREASYRIFPLEWIAANEMQQILEPLLPDGSIVYDDAKRNILIVAGTGSQIRLATNTVEIFDVDQMMGQNVHLIGLEKAVAETVATELDSIFASGATAAGSPGLIQFIPIKRLNAIMMITKQAAYIEKARNWVYRLDRTRDPTEPRIFVYYVQHGQAARMAEVLRGIARFPGGEGAPPLTRQVSAEGGAQPSDQPATGPGEPAKAVEILGSSLGISVDEEHNALLISATPKQFEVIEEVLAKLDIQPLQVMIETSIFEIELRDELRYGIQYAIANGGLGVGEDGDITLTRDLTVAVTPEGLVTPIISAFLPGFSFALEGSSRARLIIDALSALTEVNVLSSPNVIVLNNKVAHLRVGDEVPIVTQTTTSAVTDNPLIVNSVQYRNTGVNLEVTPRVNASGLVTLEILQEVSNVVVTTTSNIDSPTIQNRFLLTTVSVKSGETIMLGGLIREATTNTESGIPILHQLPVIGALFGQTDTTAERTELILLIRPVIITSPEDARVVTENLRGKFLTLLRRESEALRQPRRIVKEE